MKILLYVQKRRFYIEKQIALLVERHDYSRDHGILTRNSFDKSVKIAPTVIKPIPCAIQTH